MPTAIDHGQITFSPGAEEWLEHGPPGARRRVGFHDYAAIYGTPGLYEAVFYDTLGMCSADVVVGLVADALAGLDRPSAQERVFDLGAGNGIGGEVLRRELDPALLVGLDIEPAARTATLRDRPGLYDDVLTADLAAAPGTLAALGEQGFTTLVAVSAIGAGHIPLELLARTIETALAPGGVFAFAVAEELLPAFHEEFFARVDAERLGAHEYRHRLRADGGEARATAVVARLR